MGENNPKPLFFLVGSFSKNKDNTEELENEFLGTVRREKETDDRGSERELR